MPKLFVTVYEPTAEKALSRIASLPEAIDGVELRVDAFSQPGDELDLAAFRSATTKKLMYTRRSSRPEGGGTTGRDAGFPTIDELWAAHDASFDAVDVEIGTYYETVVIEWITAHKNFIVSSNKALLSIHDYDGVSEYIENHVGELSGWSAKLAVTPKTFGDNLRLLRLLANKDPRVELTLFGMGARGLYSRMLAPYFGSEYTFLAADASSVAAPGQLTVEQALEIYGEQREFRRPDAIFAIVGMPASHSRSPQIHNAIFRARGVNAVYVIAEVESFREVAEPLADGEELAPRGISITAPFKEEAFLFAQERNARISGTAVRARAVNTLVRMPNGTLQGGNTDVSGYMRLIGERANRVARSAVVIGAGGTARAALTALEQLGFARTVAARDELKGRSVAREYGAEFVPLASLGELDEPLVIDTLPASAEFVIPEKLARNAIVFVADYTANRNIVAREVVDGRALLEAQAVEQSAVFVLATGGAR